MGEERSGLRCGVMTVMADRDVTEILSLQSPPLIWPSLTSGMRLTGFMWDLNRQEMALSRHGFSSFNVWYILAFLENHKDKIVSQMNEE